ncbi:catenin delta-1 isoform X1 [Silurus meridionalis]|uniref:catenin delta-1 isoform X1 n=2 Tax=Silurus meridionalis TaxID=175797 RepID=UPI001EEB3518|nr:catenin delta-1 isoform X1 [Silurus meridionalis]XP_046725611.1 catenin delta-1 isoform X1 [Silurus meridionalis]XP_046725620.1 catenin delta-1 isoform X1 [Silurus meridionalis]
MEQCENAASLLASVREQEMQFERLTRALEEERRSVGPSGTLPRPLPTLQNGRIPGDAELERLKINEGYINGTQYRMLDPGHLVEEMVTVEEDPQESIPVISVQTSEDGTTRRTETTVKKVTKTTTTRTVIPSVSDTLSLDGTGSVTGMSGYNAPIDRVYRQPGHMDYPTATVPRNYHYGPPGGYDDYRPGPPSETYASLNRGARMDDRYRPVDGYRTLDAGYRVHSRPQLDPYAAQPQVGRMGSAMEISGMQRFVPEPYGLEDDQRSLGYDEPDYGMGPAMHYSTMPRLGHNPPLPRRTGSYEGTLDGDMSGAGDVYYWGGGAPLAQGERGSMASLDSTLRKGPVPTTWRQPELPEVIAMLNYRLDPVKSNAAAYLQHLTFKNDKVKSEVRRLKGIPALVSMLDNPKKEVHHSACGALKNISYGRDPDNKIAIKNCDGIPALVRLLRKTRDQDLTDTITGTLWNLSSHDSVKMEIVDHALHALSDEVMVPHSGWERGNDGGEESCKPRHLEWETALTNTAGCLRNVSSERSEARRKLRECSGLVDSLMYIVQSQINYKDMDSKLVENSVCLLRNLSYQVHREVPGCERYQETVPVNQGPAPANQKGGCFSSRKGKDEWFSKGRKDDDGNNDTIDIPKRTTAARGYELLFQPEVVRVYTSLLKESKNPSVLEASAGALQNLCAGRWTYGRYIRAVARQEKALPMMTELLSHGNDRVVRAMSGALRNLAIDARNRDLLGKHAIPNLVVNLPGGGQSQPVRNLSEETVVSVLSTLAEVVGSSVEAAKILRSSQGIERLVLINKDGNRSDREVRGAGLVLQIVWGFKELRRTLEKDGWKKSDFVVNMNPPSNTRTNGGYEDSSTLPLIDRGGKQDRDRNMIPMNDLGPDAYATLDQRGRRNTLDDTLEPAENDIQGGMYGERRGSMPLLDSYDEKLIVCITRGEHPVPAYCPC